MLHPYFTDGRITVTQGKGSRGERKRANYILRYQLHNEQGKAPRYYQEIAINRAVQAIAQGKQYLLLTLATGTGKTFVAFQICWKLWNSRWNRTGGHRRPRILFLADRNVLIDEPKDKTFTPFADARFKIEGGEISKGREMYFAPAYQLGLTATPLREDNRDTYLYFGNPMPSPLSFSG